MKKSALWIYLLVLPIWAITAPRVVLMPVQTRQVSPREAVVVERAVRLALQQQAWFRVLNFEETQEKLQAAGMENMPRCFTDKCRRKLATTLATNYTVNLELSQNRERYTLRLDFYQGTHGGLIESNRYSVAINAPNSLVELGQFAVAETFGLPVATHSPVHKIHNTAQVANSHWWVGAVSMAAVAAGAGLKQSGMFLLQDDNSLSEGFNADYSEDYRLSSVRGFFASNKPWARIRALGGAGVAMNATQGADILNPAGLTNLPKREVSFSTAPLAGGGHQMHTQWANWLAGGTWWSQQVNFEGDDLASEMSLTTNFAADLGYYSAWMVGIHSAVGIKGYFVQAGQNGTGIARSSGYGMGYGLDLGLQWELAEQIQVGLLLEDVGSDVFYHNTLTGQRYREDIPWQLTVGSFYHPLQHTSFYLDWRVGRGAVSDRILAGIEHDVWEFASIRGGVHQVLGSKVRLLTLGAALRAQYQGLDFSANYAWESAPQVVNFLAAKRILTLNLRY